MGCCYIFLCSDYYINIYAFGRFFQNKKMIHNQRNSERIEKLAIFCFLYIAHRDFTLAKTIARNKPLSYEQAEKLSIFTNQLIKTKKSEPADFITEEDKAVNDAIEKYLELKDSLERVKEVIGAKEKNKIYKSVKLFYRKRIYCYPMDSYFCGLINDLFFYTDGIIEKDFFIQNCCNEVCLFTGKWTKVDTRKAFKIGQYILNIIENGNTKTV